VNALVYLGMSALLSSILAPRLGILGLGLSYGTSTGIDFVINLLIFRFVFIKRYSTSPYKASSFFALKIILFTIFSYIMPLLGFFLVNRFWAKILL
jgi:hypothetical protein